VPSDFAGSTARYYRRYRRDASGDMLAELCDVLGLTHDDRVLDLGCGTGQVAVPLSARVGGVLAVDPEPDMLAQLDARITDAGVENVTTARGDDSDLPTLLAGQGDDRFAAVTVATALHWMDAERVFRAGLDQLRAGGGVAVITQGRPIWLQASDWARELHDYLEHWVGPVTSNCGTDQDAFEERRRLMVRVGFPTVLSFAHTDQIPVDVDYIIGNLYSAMSENQIAAPDRPHFERGLHRVLDPYVDTAALVDHAEATMLVARN
jgi:ubiquinone/menaquinone biosynthesis C-methylase UbiE